MTSFYIKINGNEYFAGYHPAVPLMQTDYGHPLVRKNNLLIRGTVSEKQDKIIIATLEGDFTKEEIDSLIDDPYQIFKPVQQINQEE